MTVFHLVRHAAHDLLGRTFAGRMPNLPINAAGLADAERLAERLAGERIDGIYTSPMQRARETAAPLARQLGLVPEPRDEVDEIDLGEWTGRHFAELRDHPEWPRFNQLRSMSPVPGGEWLPLVQARFVGFLRTVAAEAPEGVFVVVSHGDPVKSAIGYLLGTPIDLLHRLEIAPAAISTVEIGRDFVRVLRVNA